MTNAPLLGLLAIAAIWPFGHHHRDRHKDDGTIKDVEGRAVEVDTATPIAGGETKAMESYKLFLDLASDDELLRAEAMRRLADLQLEGTEIVELQGHVQALGGVARADARSYIDASANRAWTMYALSRSRCALSSATAIDCRKSCCFASAVSANVCMPATRGFSVSMRAVRAANFSGQSSRALCTS